jgi:hypothetical protein
MNKIATFYLDHVPYIKIMSWLLEPLWQEFLNFTETVKYTDEPHLKQGLRITQEAATFVQC